MIICVWRLWCWVEEAVELVAESFEELSNLRILVEVSLDVLMDERLQRLAQQEWDAKLRASEG